MSIQAAAESDDERTLLVALRTEISKMLDEGVPARDMASLSRRIMEINRDIAALDALADKEGDGVVDSPSEEWDGEF